MWFVMMTVMMAPTVWPWVSAFNRLGGNTLIFSSGYAGAWLIYSVAAASIQLLLPHHVPPSIAAAILFTAGAFQFVPFKRACLMHCRNPLTYFLTRWRDGASGGFRMGFHHGLFCVACCWALMATTLAVGRDESVVDGCCSRTVTLLRASVALGRTCSNRCRSRASGGGR